MPSSLQQDLISEIRALKAERRAVILAHNYQIPAIQDLADVVADCLRMARRATERDAPVIVICGVHLMAETAAIANPDTLVLIPAAAAGSSHAATIRPEHVRPCRTHMVSEEQMRQRGRSSGARTFVVATETGVLHRLRRANPGKEFYAAAESAECRYMKLITLEKLRDSLRDLKYQVTVAAEVAV